MYFPSVNIALPDWVDSALPDPEYVFLKTADRMALVIDLARKNVDADTGGPFGAGIFDMQSGRLVAPGVNMVIPGNCSVAHAETTAIMIAQKIMGTFDLGGAGMPAMELVSSTEPCAMCLGAVIWSGVRRLICGARDSDAREIGFDEGPKPDEWMLELQNRGIAVVRDVGRKAAVAVLQHYVKRGGWVYNARQTFGP
ncbi:nucleoside deaminase [Desulfosarcina sp.]|uniref:nucleoside deaminase n=1 Tax=Desulfosarcina sp. TaxID=2027861 RepID=UPI00397094ED